MATLLNTYYGNWGRGGQSKDFRTVINYYSVEENIGLGHHIHIEYYIESTGSGYSSYLRTSWFGDDTTFSSAAGNLAWHTADLGWIGYGQSISHSANSWYEGGSGNIYKSNVSASYTVESCQHTVVYNANGGTGAPPSQTKTWGVRLDLSTTKPTRTGYTFVNWNTAQNGSGTTWNPGDNYLPDQKGGTVTLYAQWKANTYSVTLWTGGGTYEGSTSNKSFTQNYGTTKSISFPTPPTGCTFAGFHTFSSNLSGISSRDAIFETSNGGITVYNTSNNGTVVLTREQNNSVPSCGLGSGSIGHQIKITKSAGTAYPESGGFVLHTNSAANKVYRHFIWAKIPVGYTIRDYRNAIGTNGYSVWLTEQKGTGDWYKYAYEVHTGSSGSFNTFGHVAIVADDGNNNKAVTWYVCATQITDVTTNLTYTFNSTASIECFYSQNKYTITYDANGGTGAPSEQTKTHGTAITLSSTIPTKDGYEFVGWSASSSATTATYSAGGSFTGNASTTLYAVWAQNVFVVSYDANGGSGEPSPQTKTGVVDLILSSTIPVRDGYAFLGWSTSPTAVNATYSAGDTFTTNATTTLYAVWVLFNIHIYIDGTLECVKFIEDSTCTQPRIGKDGTITASEFVESDKVAFSCNGDGKVYAKQFLERTPIQYIPFDYSYIGDENGYILTNEDGKYLIVK